jgi:hypothetical protein
MLLSFAPLGRAATPSAEAMTRFTREASILFFEARVAEHTRVLCLATPGGTGDRQGERDGGTRLLISQSFFSAPVCVNEGMALDRFIASLDDDAGLFLQHCPPPLLACKHVPTYTTAESRSDLGPTPAVIRHVLLPSSRRYWGPS